MKDVPINVDCDPRASCTQSTAYARCRKEFPTMASIIVSVLIIDEIAFKKNHLLDL